LFLVTASRPGPALDGAGDAAGPIAILAGFEEVLFLDERLGGAEKPGAIPAHEVTAGDRRITRLVSVQVISHVT